MGVVCISIHISIFAFVRILFFATCLLCRGQDVQEHMDDAERQGSIPLCLCVCLFVLLCTYGCVGVHECVCVGVHVCVCVGVLHRHMRVFVGVLLVLCVYGCLAMLSKAYKPEFHFVLRPSIVS